MTMLSVPALYDGQNIQLLEKPPLMGEYEVIVTFVRPHTAADNAWQAFMASFGGWQDDRAPEDHVAALYADRRSRPAPPALSAE